MKQSAPDKNTTDAKKAKRANWINLAIMILAIAAAIMIYDLRKPKDIQPISHKKTSLSSE